MIKKLFKALSLLGAIILFLTSGAFISKWYLQAIYNFPGLPRKSVPLEIIAVGIFLSLGISIVFYAVAEYDEKKNYKNELDQYLIKLKDFNKHIRNLYYGNSVI